MSRDNPYLSLVSKLATLSKSNQAGLFCNVFGLELKNSIFTYILSKREYDQLIDQIKNIKSGFEEINAEVSLFPTDYSEFISYFSFPLASLSLRQSSWLKRIDIFVTNLLSSRNIVNVCVHYIPGINSWKSITELITENIALLKMSKLAKEPSICIENYKVSNPEFRVRALFLSEVEGYFKIIIQEYLKNLLHLYSKSFQPVSDIYKTDTSTLSMIENEVGRADYWYKEEYSGRTQSIVNLYKEEHTYKIRNGLKASVYINESTNSIYSDIDLGCKIGAHYYIYLLSELEEYDISLKQFQFPFIDITLLRGREYIALRDKKKAVLKKQRYMSLSGGATLEQRCIKEVFFLEKLNREAVTYLQLQAQSKISVIIAALATVIAFASVMPVIIHWLKLVISYLYLQ